MYQPLLCHPECNEGSIQMNSSHSFRMTQKRGLNMHIKGIILSALILWVSLPLLAEECPVDNPLKGKDGICYSCDEKDNVYLEKEEDNSVCPERALKKSTFPTETIISIKADLKQCPPEQPFSYVKKMIIDNTHEEVREVECGDGKTCTQTSYYPGTYEFPIRSCCNCDECDGPTLFSEFNKEECSKCPNREYVDGKCILKQEKIDLEVSTDGTIKMTGWPLQNDNENRKEK